MYICFSLIRVKSIDTRTNLTNQVVFKWDLHIHTSHMIFRRLALRIAGIIMNILLRYPGCHTMHVNGACVEQTLYTEPVFWE